MNLFLYNSLSNQKEKFQPIDQSSPTPTIKMYSCGPTVYDFAHIGNFRSFLFADLLHRLLVVLGYNVQFVMNITDIDDKTIKGSQKKEMTLSEYTQKYTRAFFEDIKTLKCLPATQYPLATDHIPEMIEMIKKLLAKKQAYFSDGSIYFDITSFPEYGKLSNINLAEQKPGASQRVEADEYTKDNVSDFVLWKKYSPEDKDVYWEDEILGKGRPGWHIECSAIVKKNLGKHIEIHTGGIDNKFPHHENEIAQSICCNESNYVNYWLHCSHLLVEGKKMSKSLGNFYTLRDLLKPQPNSNSVNNKGNTIDHSYNPLAIRYLLLSAHYRTNLNFTLGGITAAEKSISRINRLIQALYLAKKNKKENFTSSNFTNDLKQYRELFLTQLSNDLNVSAALGSVFDVVNKVTKDLQKLTPEEIEATLDFFKIANDIFATFNLTEIENDEIHQTNEEISFTDLPKKIQDLVNERLSARKNKDFSLADSIREEIKKSRYEIIDTPQGSKYKKIQ